jgi:CMP-2-keto-3-deoxyoctulosonic acid synthetase
MELDIPHEYKESNNVAGHIGAAGYYEAAMFKFLRKHWSKFEDILEIEKEYSNVFYWVNE